MTDPHPLPGPEDAMQLHARGWALTPVEARGKKALGPAWQKRTRERFDPADFRGGVNIGGILGPASGGLADVDIDATDVVAIADKMLPGTLTFGRASARGSHRIFRIVAGSFKGAVIKYRDPEAPADERRNLIELRVGGGGRGAMTVLPPSVHETGELIEWDDPDAAIIDIGARELERLVAMVAAATALARQLRPRGIRHDAALALAGGLLRGGWPTREVKRFIEVVCVAAGHRNIQDRLDGVDATAKALDAGEPVTGWPQLSAMTGGPKTVDAVRRWLGLRSRRAAPSIPVVTVEAEALGVDAEAAPRSGWDCPRLDEAAMHGPAGEWVKASTAYTEGAGVGVLVGTLIGFGNQVGRDAFMPVGATLHYPVEYGLLLGPSGIGRKGDSIETALAPLRVADPAWQTPSGYGSGEALIDDVRDPEPAAEGEPAPLPRDQRRLIREHEFGMILEIGQRQGSTLTSVFRDAFDSRQLQNRTKTGGQVVASEAHISVVAACTPAELRRAVTRTEVANGVINRFILVAVKRERVIPRPGAIPVEVVEDFAQKISEAVSHARRQRRAVGWSTAAGEMWDSEYPDLAPKGLGMADEATSRGEVHTMRLAMLYALLDKSRTIQVEHLKAAFAVWRYCTASAALIFGQSVGDPIADTILRAAAGEKEVTRTGVWELFKRHGRAAEIDQAIELLERLGLVTIVKEPTGGRPRDVIRVTPKSRHLHVVPPDDGTRG